MDHEASPVSITYRGVVYPWQCDHMGHMNVTWYTQKFDEATWNVFATIGIDSTYTLERKHGMAGLEQHIFYKQELVAGDVVTVRSRVLEIREKVIRIQHEMFKNGSESPAATSDLTAAHVDLVVRKACPFPPEIMARARGLLTNSAS
jgi:acyl-CoA thioester hydrolase